jgi:hypothetical protein
VFCDVLSATAFDKYSTFSEVKILLALSFGPGGFFSFLYLLFPKITACLLDPGLKVRQDSGCRHRLVRRIFLALPTHAAIMELP